MSNIFTVTVNDNEIHRLIVNAMADSDFVTMDRLEDFIDRYDFESVMERVIGDFDFDSIVEDVIRDHDFLDRDEVVDAIDERIEEEIPEYMREYKAEIHDITADITQLEDDVRNLQRIVEELSKPSLFRRMLTNLHKSTAKIGLWRRGY